MGDIDTYDRSTVAGYFLDDYGVSIPVTTTFWSEGVQGYDPLYGIYLGHRVYYSPSFPPDGIYGDRWVEIAYYWDDEIKFRSELGNGVIGLSKVVCTGYPFQRSIVPQPSWQIAGVQLFFGKNTLRFNPKMPSMWQSSSIPAAPDYYYTGAYDQSWMWDF